MVAGLTEQFDTHMGMQAGHRRSRIAACDSAEEACALVVQVDVFASGHATTGNGDNGAGGAGITIPVMAVVATV